MRLSAPARPIAPKITAALESSTWSGHIMPYGPTKFVNGQNQGAAPVNTQVQDNDIKVMLPESFAQREAGVSDAGVTTCSRRGRASAPLRGMTLTTAS